MNQELMRLWWSRWTEPFPASLSTDIVEQARMVAGMSLIIWGMALAGFILTLPLSLASGMLVVVSIFAASLSFWFPYMLARSGRPRAAILANCGIAFAAIFAASAVAGGDLGRGGLYYLVTVCIYAATFLSLRTAAVLVLSYSVAVLLLGPAISGETFAQVMGGAFSFNLVGAGFTLLFVHYWRLREGLKRDALAQSEARYRAISEHMSDYMFFARFTADGGRVIEWETDQYSAVTGYDKQEWNPNYLIERLHPDDRARVLEGRQRVRRGEPTHDEVRLMREDGREAWIRVERIPVMDEKSGKPEGYYGIIVDITEQHRAREHEMELSLRRAQFSILETFVRAISHDFRNRLSSIETTRYLISKQVSEESLARIQPRLDQISAHTGDMITQLTNLMLIHALNNPRFERTDLNAICESLVTRHSARAEAKGLRLVVQLDDPPPAVNADVGQLLQALSQLVINALTHTPAGCVTLRTCRADGYATIEVEDSGVGIPADKIPQIFEPFYRADEARTITESGMGLGLTLVKLVIEAHHGTIAVSSDVGRGTLFSIRLPDVPIKKADMPT